jgi:DNA-binding CsgD family transcriptional regulator
MLSEALDMLDCGLLVVEQNAQVTFKNRAAALLLAQMKTLKVSEDGVLTIRPPALSAQVRRAIGNAGANARIDGVCIPKIEGSARCLALICTPLLPSGGGAPCRVAVWVVDTEAAVAANEGLLSALFALTPAEARLARGLVAGQTAEEYSRHAGVGMATVRSQLHSIFVKTGTRRQAALAALLARMAALKLPSL